jgi:uncharacterized protein YndB with AHSA1/START domain
MTPPAQHDSFHIERVFDAPPERVFGAWSTPEGKARWFGGGSPWQELIREFDFRVGGHERLRGRWQSGTTSDFVCRYHDIVPQQRIVYAYSMFVDDALISVSLSTVEFAAEGARTRLRYTEQAAYLDGYADAGNRERGTRELFERIAAALADAPVPDLHKR